jgi:natural product biosynthesis luciferase-like monooxygenase protein
MRFGLFNLSTYYPDVYGGVGEHMRRLVDFYAAAEDYGFDSVWVNEHHFHHYGGHVPSAAVFLAAIAQRTTRVRLATSVVVLSLHNPIEIAEQMAMVDLMSGGRVDLGVGRGNVTVDYDVFGVSMAEAQGRTLEGLEVIRKAWSSQPFSHHGRHFHYDNLSVWPQPEQRPHPPLWMGCSNNPDSFEYAGRTGYQLLTVAQHRPLPELGDRIQRYLRTWQEAGRDPAAAEIGTHYQVVVDEDRAAARERCQRARERYDASGADARRQAESPKAGLSLEDMIDQGRIITGTPDDCLRQLEYAQDTLGITAVDLNFLFGGITYDEARRSVELFARHVIPRLRDRQPAQRLLPA